MFNYFKHSLFFFILIIELSLALDYHVTFSYMDIISKDHIQFKKEGVFDYVLYTQLEF